MGERETKWVNRKSKIGRLSSIKEKQNRKEKKQILSRPPTCYTTVDESGILVKECTLVTSF